MRISWTRPGRDAGASDGDHGEVTHSESGDAASVSGLRVDDLDDLDQVAAIPAMPGMSFRGGGAEWWEVGQTYVESGWLRSSRDPLTGTDNLADDEAVALFGPAGRDVAGLTDHPAEQETVFLPGSRFTVVRRGDLDGLWVTVVYVHAGDEPAPVDKASDEVMRAASVLARARTLPAQPVPRPGRYAGEFGARP